MALHHGHVLNVIGIRAEADLVRLYVVRELRIRSTYGLHIDFWLRLARRYAKGNLVTTSC